MDDRMIQFTKAVSRVTASLALAGSLFGATGAQASPPPSPMSFPGCEKILQGDGKWIGSVCPEVVWAESVPYPGIAVYYFGFLADAGDFVKVRLRVDGGPERAFTMTKNGRSYCDFSERPLFEARFIPYYPGHSELDVEVGFSRFLEKHDEFGANYRVHVKAN